MVTINCHSLPLINFSGCDMVKKRKQKWFGHVSRSSGLAKNVLQDTVNENRRRNRQKKRWEDITKEIVAKSSIVPRRPSKVMGQNRIV